MVEDTTTTQRLNKTTLARVVSEMKARESFDEWVNRILDEREAKV